MRDEWLRKKRRLLTGFANGPLDTVGSLLECFLRIIATINH